jgi:branched-chain amino acid transport system permease protein
MSEEADRSAGEVLAEAFRRLAGGVRWWFRFPSPGDSGRAGLRLVSRLVLCAAVAAAFAVAMGTGSDVTADPGHMVVLIALSVVVFGALMFGPYTRRGVGATGARWRRSSGWERGGVYVVGVVVALLLPWSGLAWLMSPDTNWPTLLFFPIGVYVLLGIGLNVVVGYAGLLDLGYVAFYAIGAYNLATLGTKYHWDFWITLPFGILMAAVSGVILGAPTLRLRGDYLAIVTLGFGEIVRIVALNTNYLGASRGLPNIPGPPSVGGGPVVGGVEILKYGIVDSRPFYYILVLLAVVVIVFVKRLESSRVGRAWSAIREDEDAAEVMGVPTFRYKLLSFALGASIGGAAGVVWASNAGFIVPDNFQFILSTMIVAAVVLGGAGNLPGVVLGAFLIAWLPERFRVLHDYRQLIFGGALVLMMVLRPEGLLPSQRRRAELESGTGGMGSLGAEVAGPSTRAGAEVSGQ